MAFSPSLFIIYSIFYVFLWHDAMMLEWLTAGIDYLRPWDGFSQVRRDPMGEIGMHIFQVQCLSEYLQCPEETFTHFPKWYIIPQLGCFLLVHFCVIYLPRIVPTSLP